MVTLWVVNASPIILLSRLGRLDLLHHLGQVVIPEAAALEMRRRGTVDVAFHDLHQATRLTVINPEPTPSAITVYDLGPGESAVLTHALAVAGGGVIIDDHAARKAASSLGIPRIGTLGIIIQAKSLTIIPAARHLLEQLRK